MLNKSHISLMIAYIGLTIFVAISVYYIAFFHVSPLSRDQWHMYAPYFEKGLLQAALTPMSTHRHIFPFFIFHIDMSFFGGRNHFLIFFGSLFNCLTIFLLVFALKQDKSLSGFEKHAFCISIVSSLIWLIDIAQLGWGFMSTQYYLAIFNYLFSIFAAYRYCHSDESQRHSAWLLVSVGCGIICTFSFGMGILVWPALLYFSYLWRTSIKIFSLISLSFIICLLVFFLLPGGESIEQALLFSLKNTMLFLFELAGGPIYYLLRSYRLIDTELLKPIATYAGIIATSIGIFLLLLLLKTRPKMSVFSTLSCALLLLGLGTAALISFTRNPFFLDVWVDRYQIWAVLFWVGLLPLCYTQINVHFSIHGLVKKAALIFIMCLPILAMPSQLDLGARLSEYKIRVQQALLAYQTGIPVESSAEEALHWNWENKLPYFFTVLKYIKLQHKNIYYVDYSDYLGKQIKDLDIRAKKSSLSIRVTKVNEIQKEDLLDLKNIPTSSQFISFDIAPSSKVAGYEVTANVSSDTPWDYAVTTNESGIVNGLGIAINHSKLPRSNLKYVNAGYNFFIIVRGDGSRKIRIYFFNGTDSKEAQISEEIAINPD